MPAQGQMRVEGPEAVRGGEVVVVLGSAALLVAARRAEGGRARGCGTAARHRYRAASGRAGRHRPTSARSNPAAPVLAGSRRRERPGPTRGSAGNRSASQSMHGSSPAKVAGRRSPCAPIAGGVSTAGAAVSPTLIIRISTLSGAPRVSTGFMVSETKTSWRPTETCAADRIGAGRAGPPAGS